MGHYIIGGLRLRRRSNLRLTLDERAEFARDGTLSVDRSVEWPLKDREPVWDRAYVDPGGTDIWGAGPYLKVPNVHPVDQVEVCNRVFCPWGYPPVPVRVFRRPIRMRLREVGLVRVAEGWKWRLMLDRA